MQLLSIVRLECALLVLKSVIVSGWIPPASRTAASLPAHRVNNDEPRESSQSGQTVIWFGESLRFWKTAFASTVISGAILLGPGFPASASMDLTAPVSIALPPPTVQANILEEATLPKPDTISTISDDNKSIEPMFISDREDDQSVLEEVWTLINKYYIDRTFGGQHDWNKMRAKYTFLISKAKGEDAKFKLVKEMVATLNDKYSRVLDREQYSAIQKYDLIGVGATLMPDADKNIIVGAPPIAGSEAARVGMLVGDFVTAINGLPTAGRTAFDIIDQISENPSAQSVSMTIRPKGSDPTTPGREVKMARAFANVQDPVRYKISETRSDGTKVGFVKINEFNALVKGRLEKALAELEAAGANAYVLDIRQNTGGAFQSAVEISSLFIEDRVATYVVDNSNVKLPFRTTKGQLAIDKTDPMVIWIDGRSASASEVLAGSLHDNCRAVLQGEQSFGKGLIQAVYGLKNGAGLVLTVARYVTPSGSDIQGVGIKPDLGTKDMPFGPLGLGTDTSKIDFNDIKNRLSESSCRIPDEVQ
jgi:carboxyl-terminal processing protease